MSRKKSLIVDALRCLPLWVTRPLSRAINVFWPGFHSA
jgi:hypothetical protein